MKKVETLFEDDQLVVINKPANLLTIPDRYDPTVPNLKAILRAKYEEIFVVHRLDKETSGAIVFTKTAAAHQKLSKQFEAKSVNKLYWALLQGQVYPDEGTIDSPIAPDPGHPGKMMVAKRGKKAHTWYRLLEQFRAYSLVEVKISTGRTHQIRVHFREIGFPLAIDSFYGRQSEFYLSSVKLRRYRLAKDQEERPLMSRLTLHSREITLNHPSNDIPVTVTAPLPKDFKAFLHQLRKWGRA